MPAAPARTSAGTGDRRGHDLSYRIVKRVVLAALAASIVGVAAIPLYAEAPPATCSPDCAQERMNQYLACFEKLDDTRLNSAFVAEQCLKAVQGFHTWPCSPPAPADTGPVDVRITVTPWDEHEKGE